MLRFLLMGSILIVLSAALIIKRYSVDDFVLTIVGIILLAIGIVWKNTEKTTKKRRRRCPRVVAQARVKVISF